MDLVVPCIVIVIVNVLKLFIITGPLDSISIDKRLDSLIFNNNIINIA